MGRHEIAELLGELLQAIHSVIKALENRDNIFVFSEQQRAISALIKSHESLVSVCESKLLHYKTRIKLLNIVDQTMGMVALCRLFRPTLPDPFDPQRLYSELLTMCSNTARILEPVLEYYSRERGAGSGFSDTQRQIGQSTPSVEAPVYDAGVHSDRLQWLNYLQVLEKNDLIDLAQHADLAMLGDYAHRERIGPTEVPIHFGTTRSLNGSLKDNKPELRFLNGRGSGELILGRAVISIPPGHRIGTLEQPLTIWNFRLKPNPDKHVVLRSADALSEAGWISGIREELAALPQRTAFVFIHGFNVTFSQAIMRSGQIARDIGYEGLITAFSWGSEGSVEGYPADEDTVQLAAPKLVEFLRKLRIDAGVQEFHIVAHSMGCRALLAALKETSWWGTAETPVAEAVFAAPDVDATQYRHSIAAVPSHARRYTLYGSERDWAIAVSRSIRKNHPRAGDGGKNILVINGVETVDATGVGEHLFGLGHSYIADKRSILSDLWAVLRGLPMPRFGLKERQHHVGKYWAILP